MTHCCRFALCICRLLHMQWFVKILKFYHHILRHVKISKFWKIRPFFFVATHIRYLCVRFCICTWSSVQEMHLQLCCSVQEILKFYACIHVCTFSTLLVVMYASQQLTSRFVADKRLCAPLLVSISNVHKHSIGLGILKFFNRHTSPSVCTISYSSCNYRLLDVILYEDAMQVSIYAACAGFIAAFVYVWWFVEILKFYVRTLKHLFIHMCTTARDIPSCVIVYMVVLCTYMMFLRNQ